MRLNSEDLYLKYGFNSEEKETLVKVVSIVKL